MPKVYAKDQVIYVGKRAIPLISGEVHYWRLQPARWKSILGQVKKSGLNVIATYIPWEYHEYERGKFDFTGHTESQRNLLGFLELTRKEKFWLIIRPGPYIYSEWANDGVPDYASKLHRLHPQFLAWARDYMRVVTEVIRPYQATCPGGHIIMLQADNEIDCWPDKYGAQYGLGKAPGLFQEFIKSKYQGNLVRLNDFWATKYRRFEEVKPFTASMIDIDTEWPRGYPLKGDPELRRNLDFFEFKHHYALTYARHIVEEYRRLKIDVPIYLNTYPFFYAHDWKSFQNVSDFIGIDVYAHNEFSEHTADHRKTLDKFRYVTEVSKMSYVAEFGCGVWHSQHYRSGAMTPNHYRLITVSALMGGITGWNWYMFVNRDNWYMSPINEWGNARYELISVFEDLIKGYRDLAPWQCERLTKVGAVYNTMQYAAKTIPRDGTTLATLYDADVDYRLFDPAQDQIKTPLLFYSGNQWLSKSAFENLRDYVRKGGILVAFQDWPRKDDYFKAAQNIGFVEPHSHLFEFKRDFKIKLGREEIGVRSAVLCFEKPGGERIQAKFGGGYGKLCVGYLKKIGKGKILHLGIEPNVELVRAILRFFRIPVYCYSDTAGVNTALLKRGHKLFLAVSHNGSEDKSAAIRVPYLSGRKKKFRLRNLFSGKIETSFYGHDAVASFPIRRKDAYIFEIM